MVSFSAVDASGRFTVEYAAYTKATLVNRFLAYGGNMGIGQYGNRDKVTFEQFMRMIENNQVVNATLARPLPSHEVQHSRINAQFNGNAQFENAKLNILKKAYELGMIGFDGVLQPAVSEKESEDFMAPPPNQTIESPTDIDHNEMIISAGKVYSLGSVNGKPL